MIKKKYALSAEEIKDYLIEQKQESKEDFLIQLLMITYGLRINTIGGLRLKHLEFMNGTNTIYLPDTKTGGRTESVTEEIKNLAKEWVKKRKLNEDDSFIFNGKSSDINKRTKVINTRINKRIKDSKIIKKIKGLTFSSHMFRKTKARMAYTKALDFAKQEARKSIGQVEGSSAIEYYIN